MAGMVRAGWPRLVGAAVAGAACLIMGAIPAGAAEGQTAQVRAGEALALGLCSNCHVVAPNQPAAPVLTRPPKSFQQIANEPGTTSAGVRRFITTTHWDYRSLPMTMPDPNLLDEEADQVSAYILSLRRGPPPSPPPAAKLARSDSQLQAGEVIALKLCSYCHVVSRDARYRPTLDQRTPSFEDIANNPRNTAASLRRFISATHWDEKTIPMTMPNQDLEADDASAVVRYILSQRRSR